MVETLWFQNLGRTNVIGVSHYTFGEGETRPPFFTSMVEMAVIGVPAVAFRVTKDQKAMTLTYME